MEYIKPKAKGTKVTWTVSRQVQAIVRYYAQYTGYSEDELVERVLIQLRDSEDFKAWLLKQRRNKRALQQIFGNEGEEEIV